MSVALLAVTALVAVAASFLRSPEPDRSPREAAVPASTAPLLEPAVCLPEVKRSRLAPEEARAVDGGEQADAPRSSVAEAGEQLPEGSGPVLRLPLRCIDREGEACSPWQTRFFLDPMGQELITSRVLDPDRGLHEVSLSRSSLDSRGGFTVFVRAAPDRVGLFVGSRSLRAGSPRRAPRVVLSAPQLLAFRASTVQRHDVEADWRYRVTLRPGGSVVDLRDVRSPLRVEGVISAACRIELALPASWNQLSLEAEKEELAARLDLRAGDPPTSRERVLTLRTRS